MQPSSAFILSISSIFHIIPHSPKTLSRLIPLTQQEIVLLEIEASSGSYYQLLDADSPCHFPDLVI